MSGEDRAWLAAVCAIMRASGTREQAMRSGERAREGYRMRQEINQIVRDTASLVRAHMQQAIRTVGRPNQ